MNREKTAGLDAVGALDLDGYTVLKNALPATSQIDPRNQQVRVYRFWVPSSSMKRERFIERLRTPLNSRYGDIGDHAVFVLNEALMNAQEHAHHNNPYRWSFVQLYLFPHRIVQSVQYVPTRFDPSTVRTSAWDENGKLHSKPRGRGHIIMTQLSDALAYPTASAGGPPPFTWELYVAKAVDEK